MVRKTSAKRHLTTGRTRRALSVGTLTTQVGGSYLLSALKRPFLSVDAQRKQLLDTHLKNALLIVERSQELKGTFLKLMQMLSMRNDLLPREVLLSPVFLLFKNLGMLNTLTPLWLSSAARDTRGEPAARWTGIGVSTALGALRAEYDVTYRDYRLAEVTSKVRPPQ